jgi:type I restriction enzyme S subunit
MSEWKEYKLQEIATIVDCEHKTAPLVEKSEYISVRTSNISGGKIDFDKSNRVAKHTYEEWIQRMKPVAADIVLAREAPVGEVGWIPKGRNVCLGQRTVLIRTNSEKIAPKYLLYYLANPEVKQDLVSRSTGSVVEHLNVKDIRNFELKLHSEFDTQAAIAEILSSLDDKIDLLHRQNKTLEQMAETLFRQWFVEDADNSGSKVKLGEVIELNRGISYSGDSLGTLHDGVPMHNLNSIDVSGSYKYNGIKYYKGNINDRQWLNPGDLLLLNTDMTQDNRIIGWPILVPDLFTRSVSTHHLYSVSLISDSISKLYLYYLLRCPEYRDALANASNGTTVSMLSREAVASIEILIPENKKRIEFEIQATEILKKQSFNQANIGKLKELRDLLLPKLMSGEIIIN